MCLVRDTKELTVGTAVTAVAEEAEEQGLLEASIQMVNVYFMEEMENSPTSQAVQFGMPGE